jgi:hypothetical protein
MRNARFYLMFAVMLFSASPSATLHSQSTTIRVRFANGRNGKPLHLKQYERGAGNSISGDYKVDNVEGDSLIVTFKNISTVAFRNEAFDPCDIARPNQKPPKYSLEEVVHTGVVSPNYCGHYRAQPQPGELLIYSRHEHWWKVSQRVIQGLLICG